MKTSITSFLVTLLFWQLLSSFQFIDVNFFPAPLSILSNTFHLIYFEQFLNDIYQSLFRLVLAFLIAFPSALILSLVSSHKRFVDLIITPLIAATFPLPKVALYPLLLLIFGIDSSSKVALISLGIFYLMHINFKIGFKKILSSQHIDVIKIYPIKQFDYFWNFLIKGALQEILTGLKLSLNYGLTLVVVSEFSASRNGIGYFIWKSWDQFKIINVYSGVFALSLIGFTLYYGIDHFINRLNKY